MKIVKTTVAYNSRGEAIKNSEREYIFFTVPFNSYRDVSDSTVNEVRDREEIEETWCVLTLPKNYTADGEATPLILACHGAGGRVDPEECRIGGLNLAFDCVDRGFAALDVCGSKPHGLTLGCPEHIFALYKAYRYAVKNYNLTEKVLVAGESMGGTTTVNFINTFPSIVLSAGLIYPRLNTDPVKVGDHVCIGTWDKTAKGAGGKSTRDRIIEAYRFPNDEWCERNVIGFNPYRSRSFINSDGERVVIPPCPIKIWQGDADTVVDPIMILEFAESIRRGGCYVEVHMLEGVGHALNSVMCRELALWFDRFR